MFLHVEPHNTFAQLKARIAENFSLDASNILLFHSDKRRELVDMATVSDQEIKNDDIVYMCFPKENGSGFEEVSADSLAALGGSD